MVFGTSCITFQLGTVSISSSRVPEFTICILISSYLPQQGDEEPRLIQHNQLNYLVCHWNLLKIKQNFKDQDCCSQLAG